MTAGGVRPAGPPAVPPPASPGADDPSGRLGRLVDVLA